LTHFIGDDEPAGASQARCANLRPAGRAAQNAAKVLRISSRDSAQ
jgi:hypothetical protein